MPLKGDGDVLKTMQGSQTQATEMMRLGEEHL